MIDLINLKLVDRSNKITIKFSKQIRFKYTYILIFFFFFDKTFVISEELQQLILKCCDFKLYLI